MTKLNNNKDILKYVGDLDQVFGIRSSVLNEGLSSGVKVLDVKNGGLSFTVLPDRCLDLVNLSFNGQNCSYYSKTGIVNPTYNADNHNFFRTFTAGFLTTCGLRNVGNPVEDGGEYFGIHGRIANLPAEKVSTSVDVEDGVPVLTIKGTVREVAFFGENLRLTRTIRCKYGENRIYISNEVQNLGFRDEELMLLFHFNIGYPLLDENTRFLSKTLKLTPRDPEAEKGVDTYSYMQKPTPDYAEQVFYHDLDTDKKGNCKVAMVNEKLGIGLSLTFNKKELPMFVQWKQMGQGEYVAAMEPSNCYVGGRKDPRNKGKIDVLHSMEIRKFDVIIDLYDKNKGLDELIESLK